MKYKKISFHFFFFFVVFGFIMHVISLSYDVVALGCYWRARRNFEISVRSQSRCSVWDSRHLLKLNELLNCTLFGQQWEIKTREHDQMERMNSIHSRVSLLSVNHWDITMITHFHSGLIRAKCRPKRKNETLNVLSLIFKIVINFFLLVVLRRSLSSHQSKTNMSEAG